MNGPTIKTAPLLLALAAALQGCASAPAAGGGHAVDARRLAAGLSLWPEESRRTIAESVARAAAKDAAPPFAVFDADGTIWSSDATESFLAYLEAQGVLVPERVEPQLKVVPFLPGEGVYSYYQRLCAKDKAIGYPWCAQALSGFTLAELRRHYEAMMRTPGSKVRVWTEVAGGAPVGKEEFIPTPRLFPQQVQLIRALEECGVRVHIVTASSEELVRLLACAPACAPSFDLDLPPERVIGVNLLLRDEASGDVTSSRLRLARNDRLFDAPGSRAAWEKRRVNSFVLPPVTMYSGKVAAIAAFIHPTQAPVLAAGDSGSDFPMLFSSDGARVWVEHPYTRPATFGHAMEDFEGAAEPTRGWVHAMWDMKPIPRP